ncbi:MAG: hypothetical protein PVI90_10040 [Desulfobacteraceae bacterium]|jgi:hypothetical protein
MKKFIKKILQVCIFIFLCATGINAAEYRVIAPNATRWFWNTGNGYCGAWSVQNVGLTMGFWMGQNQARRLIGDKKVLFGINMEDLLDALRLKYVQNYNDKDNEAFLEWATAAFINNEPVIVGVKCHDIWCNDNDYDHIIPLHAMEVSDSSYNPDSMVYYSDGFGTSEKNMSFEQWAHGDNDADQYWYLPGDNEKNNWGIKITGMEGDDETIPISLTIYQTFEPDIAEGESGSTITGAVHMTDLSPGTNYTLLRWDVDYKTYDEVPVAEILASATAKNVELVFTATDAFKLRSISFYSDGITVFKLVEGTIPQADSDDGNDNNDRSGIGEIHTEKFSELHEDFETGDLRGWSIRGDGGGIKSEHVKHGSHAAWLQGKSALIYELDVSAANHILLSYWVDTLKFDSNEKIYVETSTNGRNWKIRYSGTPKKYTHKSHTINVNDDDLLHIRFRTSAEGYDKYGFIDDVFVEESFITLK